jgi:hypothetical protein
LIDLPVERAGSLTAIARVAASQGRLTLGNDLSQYQTIAIMIDI